ncbi:MAG: hypothetical protein HQK56_07415 [Deltaproteobacteria bacterium]|nr:hypothetical protein [Deltaproteobacteria bacterium]
MEKKISLVDIIEKWTRAFPGMGGYIDRERSRELDKRIRTTLAAELDAQKEAVEVVISEIVNQGRLTGLGRLGKITGKMARLADTIRFAPHGYSIGFDPTRVDGERLAAVYAFDLGLKADLAGLTGLVSEIAEAAEKAGEKVVALDKQLDQIDEKFKQRGAILTSAGGADIEPSN